MKAPLMMLAAAFAAAPALAQIAIPPSVDPGALQQQRIDEAERQRQLEQLQRTPVTDPLQRDLYEAPPVRSGDDEGPRFMVREIRFTPSEILSPQQLAELAAPYEGRQLSFADLQELIERVNAAYQAQRVVTAQAVLPAQDVSGGVVVIRLVEGRVGEIQLDGNASTRDGFITRRLALKPGDLVDLPLLERDLIRFNRSNDVQLRAELQPGDAFATTDLLLSVEEPKRHSLRVTYDNSGSPSTGKWRGGLAYQNRSLLGFRDELSLSGSRSLGQESYSIGYSIPINYSGGRLSLTHYKDRIAVKRGELASLDLTGRSDGTILNLRQPIHFGERSRVDLMLGAKKRESSNWISGIFLQTTRTHDASVGLEWQAADTTGFWLGNYTITSGRAKGAPRNNYTVGRGSLRRFHNLADGWSVRAGFNVQHSPNRLVPSSEQFMIGGEYTVRGFPMGSYAGDRGYVVNLELHQPVQTWQVERDLPPLSVAGFLFADHGQVSPYRPANSTLSRHDRLASAGFGINASLGETLSSRLTFGYGFNRVENESRRYQVHFQMMASF